jgi:hypothetical protein
MALSPAFGAGREAAGGSGGRGEQVRAQRSMNADAAHHAAGVFAGHRQHVLAVQRVCHVGAAQDGGDVLLDEVGLAFLDTSTRACRAEARMTSRRSAGR